MFSWAERGLLRDQCKLISRTDQDTLRDWLVKVFRSEEDGYQPPGEDVSLETIREQSRSPQVTFACPEMDRT